MHTSTTLAPTTPAAARFDPDRCTRVLQTLQVQVDCGRLPGAVALIARQGRVLLHEAIGSLDPAKGTPMPLDAIFRIYSMTKPLVSVAAMQLVERGKLQLTDPVARYLPAFAQVQLGRQEQGRLQLQRPRAAITVYDLLRHTAGMTYEFLGQSPVQKMYEEAGLRITARGHSNAEFADLLARMPLMFEPGSIWEYSRATDVLGALLEVVAGQSLGQLLQEQVLGPLGMVDTAFYVSPDKQHRIAQAFAHDPDGGTPMPLIDLTEVPRLESGGGGLGGTVADYARFCQCMLNGGILEGQRLLSPQTVRFMTADHLGRIGQNRTENAGNMLAPGTGFGLGFSVRLAAGLDTLPGSVGLYSWGGIAGTTFWVDPQQDMFAILMIQAPNQREFFRPLFRNMVYAAMLD
mgnify:CR=1 FL=1